MWQRASDRVLAENKLFATLDPTTRKLDLPCPGAHPQRLLLTDTVGFIRDLPAPWWKPSAPRWRRHWTRMCCCWWWILPSTGKAIWTPCIDCWMTSAAQPAPGDRQSDRPLRGSAIDVIHQREPDALFLSAVRRMGFRACSSGCVVNF